MPNCRRRGNVCLSLPTFYYRRDTLHFDRAATVRTRRRDRRRMRLVHLGRTPAARLPAIACTGPPSGTPAAPLRSVLGKGSRLPEARAARGIELLLEPFTVPLPAIPVAVDLRQVPAQPRDLPVLLLDARVPRIILSWARPDPRPYPAYRNGRTKPAVFKRGSSPRPAKQRLSMLSSPARCAPVNASPVASQRPAHDSG